MRGGTIVRAGFVTFVAGDDTLGVVAAWMQRFSSLRQVDRLEDAAPPPSPPVAVTTTPTAQP